MNPTRVPRIRGRALQERNARILRKEPLCRICLSQGRITEATEVDHITALMNGGTEEPHNLQPLCHECNELKGIRERGFTPKAHKIQGLDWIN